MTHGGSRPGAGRPQGSRTVEAHRVPVSARVDVEVAEGLADAAKAEGVSRSRWIERAIEEHLARAWLAARGGG